MKQVKLLLRKILIIYVIIYTILASMSSSFARMYDAECGEYVAQYSRDFIAKYCGKDSVYAHVGFKDPDRVHWAGGAFGKGHFIGDCTNGIHYMYYLALGVDICEYGFDWSEGAISNLNGKYSQYWEKITNTSDIQAGDILLRPRNFRRSIWTW